MKELNKSFSSLIREINHYPILYELLPPPATATEKDKSAFFQIIDKVLSDIHVDAINIPEVREESGQTKDKGAATYQREDPRFFARELGNHLNIPVIVNHVVVHDPVPSFYQWIERSYHEFTIRNVILVGGESNQIRYPGPTVREAAAWVTGDFNNKNQEKILIGGITIPTRRSKEKDADEPARLLSKALSGIEFFTSQVIYEAESMKKLLFDYDSLCRQEGVKPKRIFLSFAPASNTKDIQFLRWLGVEIPVEVARQLHQGWIGMGWRSVELCRKILAEILDYAQKNKLQVPLGINVEHVMKYNVELSKELLVNLSKVFQQHLSLIK